MFGMGARNDWTIASLLSRDLAENAQNIKAGDIPDVAVFYDGIN
jgi:hypothetical protein